MKPHIVTRGIVLARTDYQEADRILTIITPDNGKLRVIAKGVRRPKSKLAGGIELFSLNEITVLPGKSDIKTLISSRLSVHYGDIVKDIQRTMLGYELLKVINRITEDEPGPEFFTLLQRSLEALNDQQLSYQLLELWFTLQLLHINGHSPNLATDSSGHQLKREGVYVFDFDEMCFRPQAQGVFTSSHIKLLRLGMSDNGVLVMKQLHGQETCLPETLLLAKNMLKLHNRVN